MTPEEKAAWGAALKVGDKAASYSAQSIWTGIQAVEKADKRFVTVAGTKYRRIDGTEVTGGGRFAWANSTTIGPITKKMLPYLKQQEEKGVL